MSTRNKKDLNRREFVKRLGAGVAVSTVALAGCDPKNNPSNSSVSSQRVIPKDKMTYRINPKTGEQVSLLGYGCMRWPDMTGGTGRDAEAQPDQETINRLVDCAIEHGVNYFDTSPA